MLFRALSVVTLMEVVHFDKLVVSSDVRQNTYPVGFLRTAVPRQLRK
jgi:hypothetical protein